MAYNLSHLKLLLVEDNPHMRTLIKEVLHAFGIRTIEQADDGAAAFEKLKKYEADVVVIDWMMDRIDGIEFTQMVRMAPDSPNPFLPIIMLTGYTEHQRVLEARDIGVTEFMAKPVSAKALYDRLVAVIERPRQFVKTETYFGPDRRRKIEDFLGGNRRDEESDNFVEQPEKIAQNEPDADADADDDDDEILIDVG